MDDRAIRIERAQNLWGSFERKHKPLATGIVLAADPRLDFDRIGGLTGPKEEILTYACAATSPQFYEGWGTFPPTGILLIGQEAVGKSLLAGALATHTQRSFLQVRVPRLVLDLVHVGGKAGEFVEAWSQILEEMPPLTIFFEELDFAQAHELGTRRPDLPIGPIMDFLLELIDRSVAAPDHLLVGSTSQPDTLRHAFLKPGRFERIVEVTPSFPDDVVEALQIHARDAEKRAGRTLFEDVTWLQVVGTNRETSIGDWVRILHAVLRRKARCEAAGEEATPVSTSDLVEEVARFQHARGRIPAPGAGNYL
ncbi:MAG: AAA family ATPase [Proteobacteria bacterium]|nr:AAA family ATPase [Pseudomonadota bacterium]